MRRQDGQYSDLDWNGSEAVRDGQYLLTALLCEWVVRGTGSIMGISVCHGIGSIALLLLSPSVPVLCAQPDRPPPLK
jgi:hypothetical protein